MWYRDAIGAMEFRERQYASGREKMEGRRLRMPNRYRCAAVGCGIEADTGRMLMQCTYALLYFTLHYTLSLIPHLTPRFPLLFPFFYSFSI